MIGCVWVRKSRVLELIVSIAFVTVMDLLRFIAAYVADPVTTMNQLNFK